MTRPSTFSIWSGRALFALGIALQISFVLSQVGVGGGFWRPWFADARHEPRNIDFFTLYEVGHRVLHGADAYTGSPDLAPATPFDRVSAMRYPPAAAYLFGIPIRALGAPETAGLLWQAALRAMLALALWSVWRALGLGGRAGARLASDERARRLDAFFFIGGMWLCFPPLYVELQLGQYSLLMALFLLLAYLGWRAGRPARAAVFWTLSLLLKTWSVLLAVYLWKTGRRRTLAFGLGMLALAMVPYFLVFPAAWDFYRGQNASAPQLFDWHTHVSHLGFPGLYAAVFGGWIDGPALAHIGAWSATPGRLLGWAITLALLAGALAVTVRRPMPDALGFALWCCPFFFLYRDVWENHYLMLLPALTALVLDGRVRRRWIALAFFLVAVPLPYGLWLKVPFNAVTDFELFERGWSAWQSVVYHAIRPAGILVVYFVAVVNILRGQNGRAQID